MSEEVVPEEAMSEEVMREETTKISVYFWGTRLDAG